SSLSHTTAKEWHGFKQHKPGQPRRRDPQNAQPDRLLDVVMVPPGTPIPAETALIILPGSKTTIADMQAIRAGGWDIDILAHHRRGGMILGICGGYQMLGRIIDDPSGLEGPPARSAGLGLLDVQTRIETRKILRHVVGTALGAAFTGYEIHMGTTTGADTGRPFSQLDTGQPDGAISADGRVMGTYCHATFASTPFRRELLRRLGTNSAGTDYTHSLDTALDEIARTLEQNLNISGLLELSLPF
ncbi:hypothetical protein GOB85_12720, partial [Acetobacter sp. LMG 1636]|nr:hypothetical protein [Acetobacter fallax]NHO36968.1 hypothetical protein [Acetobacter fallax]